MSLVVAKLINSKLILVSDTKISFENNRSQPHAFTQGCVKALIIDSNRCLAYAGTLKQQDQDELLEIINKNSDSGSLKDFLTKLSESKEIDFIFSTLENYENPLLFKISEGSCVDTNQAWIGDHEAFSLFQKYFTSYLNLEKAQSTELHIINIPEDFNTELGDTYEKMLNALKHLIEMGSVDSVGGFVVPIVTENGELKYGRYFSIYRAPYTSEELSKIGPLSFGDHISGTYSINFAHQGVKSFAVHILQGTFGFVFDNEERSHLQWNKLNKDEVDFVEELKNHFDQESVLCMHAGHSSEDFFRKGEIFFAKNLYLEAVSYYEKCLETINDKKSNELYERKNVKIALIKCIECYLSLKDDKKASDILAILREYYPYDEYVNELYNSYLKNKSSTINIIRKKASTNQQSSASPLPNY